MSKFPSPIKGYALFDLDQTLVPWDMQLLFGNWLLKQYPAQRVYLLPFLLTVPLVKFLGARRLKRLYFGILHGLSEDQLEELSDGFISHYFPSLFYSEIREKLDQHKADGHLVILTSASPAFYVEKIGEILGVHKSFGTQVSLNQSSLFPDLPVNNKSAEKIHALKKWFQEEGLESKAVLPNSTAYTDSTADLPLIHQCEKAVLLHPSEKLQTQARAHTSEIQIIKPERPFKNKSGKILSALKLLLGVYPV